MYIFVEQPQIIVCMRGPKRAPNAVWVDGVVPLNIPINSIAPLGLCLVDWIKCKQLIS